MPEVSIIELVSVAVLFATAVILSIQVSWMKKSVNASESQEKRDRTVRLFERAMTDQFYIEFGESVEYLERLSKKVSIATNGKPLSDENKLASELINSCQFHSFDPATFSTMSFNKAFPMIFLLEGGIKKEYQGKSDLENYKGFLKTLQFYNVIATLYFYESIDKEMTMYLFGSKFYNFMDVQRVQLLSSALCEESQDDVWYMIDHLYRNLNKKDIKQFKEQPLYKKIVLQLNQWLSLFPSSKA